MLEILHTHTHTFLLFIHCECIAQYIHITLTLPPHSTTVRAAYCMLHQYYVCCVCEHPFFFAMPLSLKERWRRQWMEMNPFICHLWIVEAVKKKMCEVFVLKSAEHIWYSYFPPDETKEIFRKRERKRVKSKMRETTSIANHTRQHIQYK